MCQLVKGTVKVSRSSAKGISFFVIAPNSSKISHPIPHNLAISRSARPAKKRIQI